MSEETASLVAALREALEERKDVHLAVLFGSQARGRARRDSDVDVAVQGEGLDLLALAYELSKATRREVDVIDLARVGYSLLNAIARDGIILHQGSREPGDGGSPIPSLSSSWTVRGTSECAMRTSGSLPVVDVNLVAAKLRELAERIERVRSHCPREASTLAADADALDLVSFNLMLAVQACLDLVSHLISDESWAPAETYAEAFGRLHEHGVLSRQTADALSKAAGLRNIVAHGYAGVDPELIHRAATSGLADLEQFAREVGGWMEGQ